MINNRKRAVDLVVENKEDFLPVFPELEKPLNLLINATDSPGCTQCKRRKYERDIMSTIMLIDKSDRDISRLLILYQEPELLGALTYKPKPNEPRPAPDESMPALPPVKTESTINQALNAVKESGLAQDVRDGCPDCVCKHLSQAWVLMDEVVQGYPEHVKLALEHTNRAISFSSGRNKQVNTLLNELKKSFEKILASEEAFDTAEAHLAHARDILGQIVDNDPRPLSIWKIIGHMGEAADECVQDNPQLAARIREERLILMEDSKYRPPLAALLNEARKGRK